MQIHSYDDRAVPMKELGLKLYTWCKKKTGDPVEGGMCSDVDNSTRVFVNLQYSNINIVQVHVL